MRQAERHGRDHDQDAGRQPAGERGDDGEEEAPVEPFLADARRDADDGEQPPLPRRPGQECQGRVRGRFAVPSLGGREMTRPPRRFGRLEQHAAAQRAGGHRDEHQDEEDDDAGHRPRPLRRPAEADLAGVHARGELSQTVSASSANPHSRIRSRR